MGDVVTGQFGKKPKAPKRSSLCQHGHHNWSVDKTSQFDVKSGKLVTAYLCIRCGAKKTGLS